MVVQLFLRDWGGLVTESLVSWDRRGFEMDGFEGFVPLVGLDPKHIPDAHGVYALLRASNHPPVFLIENPVRRARLKLYSVEYLATHWVQETAVIYVGKAAGSAGLRDRLTPYSRKSSSHSGGRAVWQLADSDEVLVCWKVLDDPRDAETRLIRAFKASHNGMRPFANWTD
ncbi:hypothetical protein [Plantibacter sp. T3]|uniref:hypothetical protein n=1 Tax=Plantibacter sp. T3 TaxID=2653161 RepID=UPI0012EF95B3|nr:hypothetical protein [Plantibacter sp. T3]VXC39381.1 conserved hypothetical protein [Plantibacter sp. T3]